MKLARRIALALFVITAGVVAVGAPAAGNEVGTPPGGPTTVLDTDFISLGVGGMRGNGAGTIPIEGITGISQAFLYWNGPTNSPDPVNASVTFNGTPITGEQIGFSHDNCWAFDNSQSYRADVTGLVTGNGNNVLSNFRKSNVDTGEVIADVNGASLIIFYDDGDPSNNTDVTLLDGNDSNFLNSVDGDGWDATIATAYGGGAADLQLHVSDGQNIFDDGEVLLNGTELLPQGPNFQGDSVPGDGGATNGNLWDIKSYNLTDPTSFMSTPLTTLHLTSPYFDDCLSLVVAIVSVEGGVAIGRPGPPTLNQALAGNGEVGLNWSAPDNTGTSPITKYTVYACPSGGGDCIVLDNVSPNPNSGSTFNYVIGGLTNGTTYSFTVTASNDNGEGPPSNALSATPNGSADTDTIGANGRGTVDTGLAGGANSSDPSCATDPSSPNCKNIVARYSLVDKKNAGAVIGLASVPDSQIPPAERIKCLEFEFAINTVAASPDCETVADKTLLSTYPTNVATLVKPHFAFEQNDTTVTTLELGAPCFQLVTNANGTPKLATNGDPICKNPNFPSVFGPGPIKTNMCPDGTGWTAAKPCAYVYYKVERIDGYDLSPADCATTWPNCTWGTLANPKARRPVQCPSGPTCGKEVIIGSTIVAGIKLASGQYAVRPWCQGSWNEGEPPPSNIKWLPCDLLVVWINFVKSSSVHFRDVLWTDLEVNDPGGKRTG